MNDNKFKEKRELIKKRLSDKQRMPFEQLIDRNIHYGLNDELNEQKSTELIKKELQLHRKLLHRPQPSDIATDNDLPNDLKKADSEYYKLYEYRDPIDSISPNQNAKIAIIKPDVKQSNIDNPLDWKFGQRASAKELEIRGIIPEQYVDVAHGSKSLEDAKKEWEESRKESTNKIKNKIDPKFRPSRKDLQDRGIVPDWENPNFAKEMKEKNVKSLQMKLKQRMDPHEADQRAIINKEQLFSNKDFEEHRKEQKQANKQLKLKMQESLTQRSDKEDIIFRGIVPKEYLDVDAHEIEKLYKPNKDEIEKLYLREMNDNGNVLIDIDELKRTIEELKETNKRNQINWEKEKEIYENEIMKYKKEIEMIKESGNDHEYGYGTQYVTDDGSGNNNIKSEYEEKEMKLNEEISNLKKRIVVLEESESKHKMQINDMMKSKYKLVVNTSAEIDALRYKIKMYTQGRWDKFITK